MRLQQSFYLGCTMVGIVSIVWLMTSVYSLHDLDTSIWDNVSDWSDAILSTTPPTSQPEGDFNSEKEDDKNEAANGDENGVVQVEEPQDPESILKNHQQIVEEAQRVLKQYKDEQKTIRAQLKENSKTLEEVKAEIEEYKKKKPVNAESKMPQDAKLRKLVGEIETLKEELILLEEPIIQKKDEIDKAYEVIRGVMLDAEIETLKENIIVPGIEGDPRSIQPKGKKILLLTAFDGHGSTSQSNISTTLMMNRDEYCNYHGYTHYFVNTSKYAADDELDRSPVWWKLPAVREAFDEHPKAEWIWWVDADIIITNQLIDLAEHVLNPYVLSRRLTYGKPVNDLGDRFSGQTYPSEGDIDVNKIDIIFTQDGLGINAGSFLIRRSYFADMMLDLWQDPVFIKKEFFREEQDAYVFMYQSHSMVREHTGIVPQRLLNSYQNYRLPQNDWQHGDLAIHFAGYNKGQAAIDSWHRHFNEIVRVPEEFRLY